MLYRMKRNDNENLHKEYPELRQMTYNNKGYDYLVKNVLGFYVKIEHKKRGKNVKYDITPAQEKDADVFSLLTHDGIHYHISKEDYLKLARPHSALASGWTGKSKELSQKTFIENATTDLNEVVNKIKHNHATLEGFIS